MPGLIYQLNRKPQTPGERGLPKLPVEEAMITFQGIEGDYNRYRSERKQNNPDWALLLMPLEMIMQLNREGWPVNPGDLGVNRTAPDG